MNSTTEDSSTSNVYNLEMLLGLSSSSNMANYDTFMGYVKNNDNSTYQDCNGNGYSNKENLNTKNILKYICDKNNLINKEEGSKILLSNGMYIQPVIFNANYKDIAELIDVAQTKTGGQSTSEVMQYSFCNISFGEKNTNQINSTNASFSYSEYISILQQRSNDYLKSLLFNNEANDPFQFFNNSNYDNNCLPEYIDINSMTTQNLEDFRNQNAGKVKEVEDNTKDDVEFVASWKITEEAKNSTSLELKEEVAVEIGEQKKEDVVEANTQVLKETDSSSIKRQRKTTTIAEKRKNPTRKAQITKASLDLIEKLTIPSSIFNARVKGKTSKPNSLSMKNIRQSCRTSGAIYCPPGPLTISDFKEWPVDGMHERPFYDAATGTIIKYHIQATSSEIKEQNALERTK